MKRLTTILTTAALAAMTHPALAQQSEQAPEKDYTRGWYIGAQAGMPMAEADFSSFGADKFRPGWSAGIHAGYRFTRVWSVELAAGWGQQFLAEQQCCFERGYWLGSDFSRYHPALIPSGMEGWYYKDLKSRTFVQRYGLQVNFNVLGLFNRTKESRWRLELSPAVCAAGTSSDLMTKADNTPVAGNLEEWHLGYGGQAQVSYAVVKNMNVGIYGGFTHLTGDPMDGMPELHSTNFIIDAGVKFSFAFGTKKSERSKVKTENGKVKTENEKSDLTSQISDFTSDEDLTSQISDFTSDEDLTSQISDFTSDEDLTSQISDFTFPVIYFSFNSVWIEPSERAKAREIADMMKADPDMRVRITGWGDKVGTREQNKRVSLQRAEAVKRALGQRHITADRIETVAGGIRHDAANDREARSATIEIKGRR